MKCEHCGTENNFEWSTFCRSCHEPLRLPESDDSYKTHETTKFNMTNESGAPSPAPEREDDKIEIGVSDPMDYIMASQKPAGQKTDNEPSEKISPEPIESELTLYRDQNVKLSITETPSGPKVTMEPLSSEMPEISPGYAIESLQDMAASSTAHQTEPPSLAQPPLQSTAPEPPSPAASEPEIKLSSPEEPEETEHRTATQRIDLENVGGHDKKSSEILSLPPAIDRIGQVKQSLGVIYLAGNSLKLTGGVRVIPGDHIKMNDREFEVKPQPKSLTKFYLAICGGVFALFLILLMAFGLFKQDKGQLAGIITNPENRLLAGKTVRISDLGKTASTNLAGFFTFEQISSGIHTIEFQNEDNTWTKETVTILKGKTSTITLKTSRPELPAIPGDIRDTTPNQSDRTETPLRSGKGTLKLNVNPSTASAYINDKPLGAGSNSYNLSPGTYTLTVKKQGYQESTQKITIESERTLSLRITLAEEVRTSRDTKTDTQAGREQELAGNYKEALNYYNRALGRDPRNVAALLGKARCARASGNAENAVTYYSQAAKVASEKGDVASQIDAMTGIIEVKPNTFTAYANRGELFYDKGDYAKAIDDFSRVVELDNRNLSAYYKLGNSFYNSSRYQEALKTFLAAQELNFADPKAEAYIAKTYLALGDKKNCRKAYERFKDIASYSARLEFKRDPEWQKVLSALGVTD